MGVVRIENSEKHPGSLGNTVQAWEIMIRSLLECEMKSEFQRLYGVPLILLVLVHEP